MFERLVRDAELEDCLAIAPGHLGDELVGREKALAVWRGLMSNPSFNNGVFFAEPPPHDHEILAFGAGAFVSTSFVDSELEHPRAGLNARFIAAIANGDSPVLDKERLRHGNTYGGLDILCLTGAYRQDVSHERALELLSVMSSSFVAAHSGYRIRRVISEAIGEVEVGNFQLTGGIWRCVGSFEESALFVMSADETLAVPTSNSIPLFRFTDPVLRLREPDQVLLKAALCDLTDEDLAHRLNVHIGTVKKRWLEIYHRIAEARPELLFGGSRSDGEQTRGKQKRHHVLSYIREHPEELRPYEFSES